MPTPSAGYWRDGQKLVGTTTVLRQKDSSGLISAANSVGLKGKKVYGPEGEWSRAADIGTAVHLLIQTCLEGAAVDLSTVPEVMSLAALPAFESFQKWAERKTFPGKCEVGLVHPIFPFGGTIDYLDAENHLIFDWKTNSSLDYVEELYGQMGAYTLLASAHGHVIKTSTIVRFPKEGGKAEELVIDPASRRGIAGQEMFLALLDAYTQRAEINREDIEPGLMAKVGKTRRR